MASNKQIIIAVDIENLEGCAREDPYLRRYPRIPLLHAAISAIECVAREQYPQYEISWRITALSTEASDAAENIIQRMRSIEELVRLQYHVETVQRSPNAADIAITTLASALLHDRRIKACVLATQDSGLPFVEFLQTVSRRTHVHLIGLSYVPDTFQAVGPFPCSLIRENIIRLLQQDRDRRVSLPCRKTNVPSPAAPPVPTAIPTAHRRLTVRDSARMFLQDERSLTNADHYAWLVQARVCLEKTVQGAWQGTFMQLYRGMKAHWRGPAPPDETLREILRVFEERYFVRTHILVYKP